MNPNLPFHYRVPHNGAGSQRIGIASKLVRPFRTRQQLPDTSLTSVNQFALSKDDSQQWRRPVVIRF